MVTRLKGNRKKCATRGSITDHRICGRGWSVGLLSKTSMYTSSRCRKHQSPQATGL